mmetsp:Transcript_11527/g.23462  ORF Transcript_11527/g.23462 Transcript_11527/m.23462 type:complete len:287 (+) Transcript_11527:988-1848(+)
MMLSVASDVRTWVERGDGDEEEKREHQRCSHAVRQVIFHSLKDLAAQRDGSDDGREPLLHEHDVCGRARCVRRSLHGDTDVGLLERGRIVDAVARHAGRPAPLLHYVDDHKLVLGEDSGEAVGNLHIVHHLDRRWVRCVGRGRQLVEATHRGAHAKRATRLTRDRELVTRDHLDPNSKAVRLFDRVLRVGTRRVEEGDQPAKRPAPLLISCGDGDASHAPVGKVIDGLLKRLLDRFVVVSQLQHHGWRALGDVKRAAARVLESGRRALNGRVKRLVIELLVRVELI